MWTSDQPTNTLPQKTGVYLLHFHGGQLGTPGKGTAKHYMGSTVNLQDRMRRHMTGNGARLPVIALEKGLTLELVKFYETETAEEARLLEKKYKNWGHFPDIHCPICKQRRGLL